MWVCMCLHVWVCVFVCVHVYVCEWLCVCIPIRSSILGKWTVSPDAQALHTAWLSHWFRLLPQLAPPWPGCHTTSHHWSPFLACPIIGCSFFTPGPHLLAQRLHLMSGRASLEYRTQEGRLLLRSRAFLFLFSPCLNSPCHILLEGSWAQVCAALVCGFNVSLRVIGREDMWKDWSFEPRKEGSFESSCKKLLS